MSIIIKCGKLEFEVTDNDIISDNGHCTQITTQKISDALNCRTGDFSNRACPVIAKTLAKKLIKNGDLVLIHEEYWHKDYKIKEEMQVAAV